MNKLVFAVAWTVLSLATAAHAAPIRAVASANGSMTVVINGGVALDGIEVTDTLLVLDFDAASALDAPDASNTSDSTAVIAGLDPSDPSIFTGFDRTSRNADTEGAQADYYEYNYGIRVPSTNPGVIANPLVDYGKGGSSLSQAQISTEPHDTSANSVIDNRRLFTFENYSNNVISFDISGELELSVAALFEEAAGFARGSGTVDMLFDSADPLDIVFSELAPYVPEEFTDGANTATTLSRFTDAVGVGMVGLGASASAIGVDALGTEVATAMATDDVLLEVTLQPGQVMTMEARLILTTGVEIQPLVVTVPVPGGLLLVLIGLIGLGARRLRHPAPA